MKHIFFVMYLTLLAGGLLYAQDHPYRVVFDLTSRDSLDQKAVLRWIKEVSTTSPNADMEVVMYAKGIEMVVAEKSAAAAAVQEAMKNPKVSFAVCEIAMKNNKIEKSQLLPGVKMVPDGIYEIFLRQREGWGYIKVAH